MNEEQAEVYLDCIDRLVGAPEVKTRVLNALALGNPSYESHAHLVKCRVKDIENLAKKINDRRTLPEKSDYRAANVTDIVGLRLLALYRRDLPLLVREFLKFLDAGQNDQFFLFTGNTLDQACTEIILYSSANENDRIDNAILEVFESRGIRTYDSRTENDDAQNSPKLRVKLERKDSGYSSLHIIVWCRNPIRPEPKYDIPMEVQIRTSLEDVWGEIDHALKYKYQSADQDGPDPQIRQFADETLRNLKSQLDTCGTFADIIAQQLDYSKSAAGREGPQRSAYSVNLGTLASLPLPENAQETISPLLDLLNSAIADLRDAGFAKDPDQSLDLASKFTSCAIGFMDAYQAIAADKEIGAAEKKESSYYLLMEAALCHYFSGTICEMALACAKATDEISRNPVEFYDNSLSIYMQVQRNFAEKGDAILSYRKANVYSAMGQLDVAKECFREAVENLESHTQENLADDHYLRVRIPRQYGISLWEEAEKYRLRGEKLEAPDFRIDQRRVLYKKALAVTLPLLDFVIGQTEDGSEKSSDDERLMTANNIVDYAICVKQTSGTIADLEELGLDNELLAKLADAFVPEGGVAAMDTPIWLDTLRKHRLIILEDMEGAKEAARRVIEILEAEKERSIVRYGERFYEEMLEDAHKTLDTDD